MLPDRAERRYMMKKPNLKGICAVLLGAAAVFTPAAQCARNPFGIVAYAEERSGTVNATSLNVRKGPGTSYSAVTRLNKGARVAVLEETRGTDGNQWYKIRYGSTVGYVSSSYIRIGSTAAVSDAGFDSELSSGGFPESYRPMLQELHASYPNWTFRAYKTGLSWNTVINEESKVGRNLVERDNISSWKSTEDGAYDWNNGTWTGFDGSTWVAASREIIEYYMDPRNFLNDSYIFQFMDQSYDESLQSEEGLTQMVKGTFLAGTVSSSGSSSGSSVPGSSSGAATGPAAGPGQSGSGFTDSTVQTSSVTSSGAPGSADAESGSQPGGTSGETYVSIIMDAARESGVNPYIIASMILQEQGAQGQGRSISGTVTGYGGYYNFFNIEAYTSGSMSAVERGLWWASQSGSYGRPWNSVRASIVGGAKWYGENYVKRGQVNLYLKKYNVTSDGTYKHQYMTNVLGAAAEGLSLAKISALKESAAVFTIPVYSDMPSEPRLKPTGDGSPNNKLRGFGIEGFGITPSFARDTQEYEVSVNSSVASLKVCAAAIDSSAAIAGAGEIPISDGRSSVSVQVTAENGAVRTYTIKINRSADGPEYNSAIQPDMNAAASGSSSSKSSSSEGSATGPGMSSASWTTRTSSSSESSSSKTTSTVSTGGSGTAATGSSSGPGTGSSTTIRPIGETAASGSPTGTNAVTKGPGEGETKEITGYHAWQVEGPGLGKRN